MKTSLKIAVLFVALATMTACSAQRRAERLVRRAVALNPELVQAIAHPFDTVITMPGYADVVELPVREIYRHDTIYAATTHGTVVVSLRQPDSALRVGFVAAPQEIHYQDTVLVPQVVVPDKPKAASNRSLWEGVIFLLLGVVIGAWVIIYLFRNTPTQYH